MTDSTTVKPIANLHYSVNAYCPHCKTYTDIAKDDPDNIVSNAIFNNKWDALNGYEVICEECHKPFEIEKVEY